MYRWTIGISSDAEQKRVQQRLTQRKAEALHITRGPGRWTRVGSPSNQTRWFTVSGCFTSFTGVLSCTFLLTLDGKKCMERSKQGGREMENKEPVSRNYEACMP